MRKFGGSNSNHNNNNKQQTTSNKQQTTSNKQQATNNKQQQTTTNKKSKANQPPTNQPTTRPNKYNNNFQLFLLNHHRKPTNHSLLQGAMVDPQLPITLSDLQHFPQALDGHEFYNDPLGDCTSGWTWKTEKSPSHTDSTLKNSPVTKQYGLEIPKSHSQYGLESVPTHLPGKPGKLHESLPWKPSNVVHLNRWSLPMILLMAEIRLLTTWDVWNPINNGKN